MNSLACTTTLAAAMNEFDFPEEVMVAIVNGPTVGMMISSQFGIALEDVGEWIERQTTCMPEETIRRIEEYQQERAQIAMDLSIGR